MPHTNTTVETRFRVRYAETDQMGVVYHAHYVVWMEIGRVEYCRSIGVRYRDMEEQDGVLLAVAKVRCRFIAPARYDDEVTVATTVARAHPRLVAFAYAIRRAEDGQLLAEGETTHVFCDRDLQPRKLPSKYWNAFGIGI
jgi:acyl-CoA thioester hydrolase